MAAPTTTGRLSIADFKPTRRVNSLEAWATAELLHQADAAEGPALDQLIAWLTTSLRQRVAHSPDAQVSEVFRLIAYFHERREVSELAADPARQAGVKRAAKTFAHKLRASE